MLLEKSEYTPPVFERTHPLTDSPILLRDGSTLSAQELADRFYHSELGTKMPNQPLRYHTNFGYDRDEMQSDLGYDLCPIGHQMELAYHAGTILDVEKADESLYGALPEEEIGILMLTCMLHDIGEHTDDTVLAVTGKVVGDIPAGLKTDDDRLVEKAVRQFFYERLLADVDPGALSRIEAIISHEDTTHLHDIFQAAHAVQTVETANFAHHRLTESIWHRNGEVISLTLADGARLSGLLGIARIVADRIDEELEDYSFFGHVANARHVSSAMREPAHILLN